MLGIFVPVIPHERAPRNRPFAFLASAAKAVELRFCYGTAEAVPVHKNLGRTNASPLRELFSCTRSYSRSSCTGSSCRCGS